MKDLKSQVEVNKKNKWRVYSKKFHRGFSNTEEVCFVEYGQFRKLLRNYTKLFHRYIREKDRLNTTNKTNSGVIYAVCVVDYEGTFPVIMCSSKARADYLSLRAVEYDSNTPKPKYDSLLDDCGEWLEWFAAQERAWEGNHPLGICDPPPLGYKVVEWEVQQ